MEDRHVESLCELVHRIRCSGLTFGLRKLLPQSLVMSKFNYAIELIDITAERRMRTAIGYAVWRGKGAKRRKSTFASEISRIARRTWVDRRIMCKVRRTGAGRSFVHTHSWRTSTPCITLENSTEQFRTQRTNGQNIIRKQSDKRTDNTMNQEIPRKSVSISETKVE